jgi:hypothetical protein
MSGHDDAVPPMALPEGRSEPRGKNRENERRGIEETPGHKLHQSLILWLGKMKHRHI